MDASRSARSRARAELTREITDAARRQLAAEGAERLSLRAVARELDMVPSALYRYFPSREDLLTALIIDAYVALGDRLEQDVRAVAPADHRARWQALGRGIRRWAVEHRHEFTLLFGSPVAGYAAPEATVPPATRVYLLLLDIAQCAHRDGALGELAGPVPHDGLAEDLGRLRAELALPDLPPAVLGRCVAAWTQLVGAVSLELFGHLRGAFTDDAAFYEHVVDLTAASVGLGEP